MAKLHFRYGAMGSAKTAQALMLAYNFNERGRNTLVVKPAIDTRTDRVWSRTGLEQPCITSDELLNMSDEKISKYKLVVVDECQFLNNEEVEHLAHICDDLDITVIAFGLKTDYMMELFDGSRRLLELADEIEEIKTSCWCGAAAKCNARIENGKIKKTTEGGSNIEIENKEGEPKYVALCRKHYNSGQFEPPNA